MKKILIPALLLVAAFFTACNPDRLDIPQKGVVLTDEFYQTDEDCEGALVAAYQGVLYNVCTEEGASIYAPYRACFDLPGDDMYAAGMQAYNSGLNDEAELAFKNILSQYPKHGLASNAQYWLGEVYTKQGDLNNAKIAFKNGYQNYKNGNKAPDSLYRLGITLENLKDNKSACIVFMSFDVEFPKANAELKRKAAAEAKKLGCK